MKYDFTTKVLSIFVVGKLVKKFPKNYFPDEKIFYLYYDLNPNQKI